MASTSVHDPYLDPETGILRNKVGAKDKVALVKIEGDLVSARVIQLLDNPPRATGDLGEWQAIHRFIFQDIFMWAGELRVIDMKKDRPDAEFFLPKGMIERAAAFAANELNADNNLRGMARDRFVERLAYHYDGFNYIHPFREGNGRTQRIFWNRIARDAGWLLDWRPVHGIVNDEASRAGYEDNDLQPLREMFDQIVTPLKTRSDRGSTEWQAAERTRLAFPSTARDALETRRLPPSPSGVSESYPSKGRSSGPGFEL